jgi:DNA-binding beta-propeller fold protein YncE
MKFAALAWLPALAFGQPLRLDTTIPLPNVEGRIDHIAVDVSGKRLFVAAFGGNSVEVIDLTAGRRSARIQGLQEPQGLFYLPEANRLYVANAKNGHVGAYDGKTLEQVKDYDFNSDADNLRFDPKAHELFVGYGDGALGVINANLRAQVDQIVLDSHPESFQLETLGPRIFVNVPGERKVNGPHIAVIDRRTRSITTTWPISSAQLNFPMALDEADHRLFIGCRKPAKLVVFDTDTGKEVTSADIVGDADDLFYDSTLKRIYVSGGAGAVTVLAQRDSDRYETLATIPSGRDARTSLFVPEFKRLYVAVPHRGKQPAALLAFAAGE